MSDEKIDFLKKGIIFWSNPFNFDELDPVPDRSYTIIIDAGHGGKDPGTIAGNILEKDLSLALAKKLSELSEGTELTLVLTRTDDLFLSLKDRVEMGPERKADLFLSLHINNSDDPAANGLEAYISSEQDTRSESIGRQLISSDLKRHFNAASLKQADFFVLRNKEIPSVLLNLGYISNKTERDMLSTNLDEIATDLFKALENLN